MSRQEFFKKVHERFDGRKLAGISLIERAYWFAKSVHQKQKRDEGERYFEHIRRVALILLKNEDCSVEEIALALLHDCIEDGFIPEDVVDRLFGGKIRKAIETISKVAPVFGNEDGFIRKTKKDIERYWKDIALAPAWVERVKLADRLDNLRSMSAWSPDRQARYVEETKKYIFPIAQKVNPDFAP